MHVEHQSSADLAHLAELISPIGFAMLTNFDAAGALTSRPMAPVRMDAHGAIWFLIDLESTKADRLQVLNLTFTDADHSTYVSLAGHGELDTDRVRIARLWTDAAKPWFPDGPGSVNLALLKFVPHTAEYWDGPRSRIVRSIALVTSKLIGQPVGLGEHGTVTQLTQSRSPAATD